MYTKIDFLICNWRSSCWLSMLEMLFGLIIIVLVVLVNGTFIQRKYLYKKNLPVSNGIINEGSYVQM